MNHESPTHASPILVALGSEARTLRLVHAGFRMAREQGRPWVAVHVEVMGWETAEEVDQARVWLQEAHELGAEVTWIKASSVVNGLVVEARRHSASTLVMGKNLPKGLWSRLEHSKAQAVLQRTPQLRVVSLTLDTPTPKGEAFKNLGEAVGAYIAMAVLLAVCGIGAAALEMAIGFPAIPAIFSLGVAFLANRWGRLISAPATLLSLLIYDYFFESHFTLAIEDWRRFLIFLGTLVTVQVVVELLRKLRLETRAGRRREAETVLLMLLGRALARCSTVQEVSEVLARRLQNRFQAKTRLLIPQEGDAWTCLPEPTPDPDCPPPSQLLPEFGHASTREDPLEPFFLEGCSYISLASTGGTEGLLQMRLANGGRFPPESSGSLQAFAVQGALALERVRWVEAAQQARLESEAERLRSSLLSSISHDLRTPLAGIQGAASSLLLPSETLPESTRRDMLAMIHDESERLAQLIGNLLDITRLESGAIQLRKEWQPVDEVVGVALRRTESGSGLRNIRLDLPEDLPLVPLDAVLTEQLLINLLANARRHAPDSTVDLKAWSGADSLELEVADRGPGIPEAFRERVFDKFFRLPGGGDGGVGLGLAICDAIAKAHGGRIWVENRPGGGASFRVSLPLSGSPPPLPDPEHIPEDPHGPAPDTAH